jgi:hypothetical protein
MGQETDYFIGAYRIQMYVNAPPPHPPPPPPRKQRTGRREVTGMKGEQTSDNKQTIGRRGARDSGQKTGGAYTERNCDMTNGKGKITTFFKCYDIHNYIKQ